MANRKVVACIDLALLDPDGAFPARLATDRATLVSRLCDARSSSSEICEEQLKQIATLSHKLAGAAGTFGYVEVSDAALTLEELILDRPPGQGASVWLDSFRQAADRLVQTLDEALLAKKQGNDGGLPIKVSFRSG